MILADAGPLVAIVDAADQHHASCKAALQRIHEPLVTVWPALTEAAYLLSDVPHGQDVLLEMVDRGALQILRLDAADLPRIRQLMRKYSDLPMDLADAAIVRAAEREGIGTVFTIDQRDFGVYRLHGRTKLVLIP